MDLKTRYLGLDLKNPLVASASPLGNTMDGLRRLEDAGLSAIVLHSLFEEQIEREAEEIAGRYETGADSHPEAATYLPAPAEYVHGPESYLEHLRRAKEALDVPVIASLNGHSPGGWTRYAKLLQHAGADALELNIYYLVLDPDVPAEAVEAKYVEILRQVKAQVDIPVAVKLGPFFTSFAHLAKRLDGAGADGLVLFNRFYQPDIDIENLEVVPSVNLSTHADLRLPLRWIAILHGQVKACLAATGGVHRAEDLAKALMAGADVAMACSSLYRNGIRHAEFMLEELVHWMEKREYESLGQMRGSMSQRNCPDPKGFERANYIRAVKARGSMEGV